jgi:hypothetical protein
MGISAGPQIIRDSSLVLGLDASDANSNYRSTGRIWNDLSGNNNTGSIVNGATLNNDGYGSFVFNGINSHINIGNPSVLNVYSAFTLSTWFKLSSSTTFQSLIARGRTSNQWDGYELSFNGGSRTLRATSENAVGSIVTFDLVSNRIVDDGNWHHGVFTFNGTTGIMYVDGTTAGSSTGTFNSNNHTNYIGRRENGAFFSGSIANVQIYNKALSATEIQNNYNQYLPRFTSPTPNIITYTSFNQATAITVFNDDIEFSNILIGTPYPLANAIVTSNSPSI